MSLLATPKEEMVEIYLRVVRQGDANLDIRKYLHF
jgi:hypothetical protein